MRGLNYILLLLIILYSCNSAKEEFVYLSVTSEQSNCIHEFYIDETYNITINISRDTNIGESEKEVILFNTKTLKLNEVSKKALIEFIEPYVESDTVVKNKVHDGFYFELYLNGKLKFSKGKSIDDLLELVKIIEKQSGQFDFYCFDQEFGNGSE